MAFIEAYIARFCLMMFRVVLRDELMTQTNRNKARL